MGATGLESSTGLVKFAVSMAAQKPFEVAKGDVKWETGYMVVMEVISEVRTLSELAEKF